MNVPTDDDLYRRGSATLVASWEEYARGAAGADMQRLPGVAAAVFANEPERCVYNNALLAPDLTTAERARALDEMEAANAAAGVTRFAAWVHESDEAMRTDLERRDYTLDQATRAMGMSLDGDLPPRPEVDLARLDWAGYVLSSACHQGSSREPITAPSTSWSHASMARAPRPRWRSISAVTAGSTT